jgi:hypothetical protein
VDSAPYVAAGVSAPRLLHWSIRSELSIHTFTRSSAPLSVAWKVCSPAAAGSTKPVQRTENHLPSASELAPSPGQSLASSSPVSVSDEKSMVVSRRMRYGLYSPQFCSVAPADAASPPHQAFGRAVSASAQVSPLDANCMIAVNSTSAQLVPPVDWSTSGVNVCPVPPAQVISGGAAAL